MHNKRTAESCATLKILLLILLAVVCPSVAGEFGFTREEHRLVLTQSGRPLAEYVVRDARIPRLCSAKLRAPDAHSSPAITRR